MYIMVVDFRTRFIIPNVLATIMSYVVEIDDKALEDALKRGENFVLDL